MIDFVIENLLLLPFLFVTYLVLETIEVKAGGALGKFLERARSIGPVVGGAVGAVPQCGFSAAAASLYSGGIITLGTLLAVFLSTSDELVPVLLNAKGVGIAVVFKIVAIKVVAAIIVGFIVNAIIWAVRGSIKSEHHIKELCEHSHCHCGKHRGVVIPALIHTAEIFLFILIVSGVVHLATHHFGTHWMYTLQLDHPFTGALIGAAVGLIPNCASSVACAQMYANGAMGAGALMASSFAGSGVGIIVLFRGNRNLAVNLGILLAIYALGVILGWSTSYLL